MKTIKLKLLLTLATLFACANLYAASEYGITWTYANQHQTTNTAWTPTTSSCVVNTLFFNVSNAGTAWVITVKMGNGNILWSGTATVGNFPILSLPVGIQAVGGLTVTFAGTAGVADFTASYR